MHKNGKWAKRIMALQESDGKWGCFHTLSQFYGAPITTEQALRRLERLGYTIEDECIQKAVNYMTECLTGKKRIPDPREKIHDWDIFTSLMLSTWIRRFTSNNPYANQVANQWTAIITSAFSGGTYDHQKYTSAYREILGLKPNGGKLIDFVNFYPISLLRDCLDPQTERAVVDYVIHKNDGIYYIYEDCISILPQSFQSKRASRYLAAIELLSAYPHSREYLHFVANWLNNHRNEDGKWDMGKSVNDKLYFPLSDDWRKHKTRESDCTERIGQLLMTLSE